jgi:tetratricopeptide (TPR) repeat protein
MGMRRVFGLPILPRVAFPIVCCIAAACGEFCRNGLTQELDTALQQQGESRFTVMDEVHDPRERSAFLDLYKETAPEARHRLAERFIADFPQSWLLGHAYEIAAKASIDLDSYDRAIAEAKQSLRLFPENPLLLVPLANVAAQRRLMPLAERSAKDALVYLDEFGPPSGTKKHDWPELRSELKASAYFALGRVYAARAFGSAVAGKTDCLRQSFDFLTTALRWNPNDAEIYFLRGVVLEGLGRSIPAAENYAESSRRDQNLRPAAQKSLRRLYAGQQKIGSEAGFDQFLSSLARPGIAPAHDPANTKAIQVGAYAGSTSCVSCHRREYESWQNTGMSRMFRPYKAENIIGDFGPKAEFRGDHGDVIRMGNDGRPFFEVMAHDGRFTKFHVDFTIGSKWQQGYVTKLPDGRLQVLPIEYNKIQGRWVNYWKVIDPPSSVRANVTEFPKLLPATNYQLNCAVCHTSQLRAASTREDDIMRARFEEPGVNCEMCHGPSKDHVDEMRHTDLTPKEITGGSAPKLPVDFLSNSNREEVSVCAQCHRQSSVREASVRNELNFSSAGQSFLLPAVSRTYPEFLRRAFYKDGRFRETTFIVEAFTRSACYLRGTARCSSCHDPHPVDAETNPVSLKFRDNPDQRCLQCHEQFKANPEKHTHHAASSAGSRCEACHMPRIMNSVLFEARSHQIDDVPDAALTLRFGRQDSPNACLLCHADKDGAWASDKLAHW